MRERFLASVTSAFFILLAAGLFYTQIIKGPYYSKLSKTNSIRIVPIEGPRGDIFDRNGNRLVTNRLSFNVSLIYQQLRDKTKVARALSGVIGMSPKDILEALEKSSRKPYAPVTILEDIDKDRALELEEASFDLNGLVVQTRPIRSYIYNSVGSHIAGYLGEITRDELEELKPYGYRMKDSMGRDGLEKYYDTYLRGRDGGTQVEVDNQGRQTRVLGLKEPRPGRDLHLTIDMRLQILCETLLGDRAGAIIVADPQTGEVLALASHPAFDPNVFVKPKASAERLKLLNDRTGRPLSNKAISGLYPPGSIFKIVTACAALETRKINPGTVFSCSGSYSLGNAKFDCWKEKGHGPQNIIEGLKNSCNVFFYNTARVLRVDNMESFARLFGFGRPTGIDLPDEVKGLVPGKSWKRAYGKGPWYDGETLNYGIGQGYLLVTPVQVMGMMACVANAGTLVKPYIVQRIDTTRISGPRQARTGLRYDVIETVKDGLVEVVNSEDGTGKRARAEGIKIAGKTGTAQNPQAATHAWFSGFAPYDDPRIVLVVFLEHGGKGGLEPAEIARGIFEEAHKTGYL